jgi:two-component system, chemotaxis family, sensor histidine kinase and response regulator WspE
MDEIDFLSIFRQELDEEVRRVTDLILELEKRPEEEDILRSLMREFHTIKGAARAIQFDDIRDIAHGLEDIYHALLEGRADQRNSLVDLTLHAIDLMQGVLSANQEGRPFTGHETLPDMVRLYLEGGDPNIPEKGVAPVPPEERPAHPPGQGALFTANPEASSERNRSQEPDRPAPEREPARAVSDGNGLLDTLMNLSGEITVSVGTLDDHRRVLLAVSREMARLAYDLGHREGRRRGGSHPAALLQERLRSIQVEHSRSLAMLDATENRLRILSEQLDSQVTKARLVPLDTVFSAYPRQVRDLSHELQKKCDLTLVGQETRIDQEILGRIRVPLLHLIRNALDHGIEAPEERVRKGKSPQGTLRIQAAQFGSVVRITLSDDGAGVDMARVKQKVLARGDTTETLWEGMDPSEREQFLYLPGFTTASEVSQTSGRGVGLDIVKTGVEQVGGKLSLKSVPGQGTDFTLELPLTLSLTRCLLVRGGKHLFFGDQHYALPLRDVERVCRITRDDLRTIEGRRAVRIGEETLPLVDFSTIMALEPLADSLEQKHLLVLEGATRRIGLLVEGVFDEQHIVHRKIVSRVGKVRHVDGATILSDGNVALIVDVLDLMEHAHDLLGHNGPGSACEATDPGPDSKPGRHVLVVEDSQTVREVVRHFLESAGYRVTTAVNGMDGLNKLKAGAVDIVISDIDMPRMNGIEMVRQIRSDPRYRDLPIIVVSYKDREEDRKKALEAGINLYVTKSEFDSMEMLERIRDLVPGGPDHHLFRARAPGRPLAGSNTGIHRI